MTSDIASWARHARTYLHQLESAGDSSEKALAVQCLIAHATAQTRPWILTHPDHSLTTIQENKLDNLLKRLGDNEPLPYLLGHWEFFGLDFIVSPAVLIPRPETELLVQEALKWLHLHPHIRCAMDVGTGSGCIAISLASAIKYFHVLAIDRSSAALKVAKMNVVKHNIEHQITLIQGDLCTAISNKKFQLICANLPYIPTSRLMSLRVSKYEPRLALDGGKEGMDYLKSLLLDAKRLLADDGLLLLEIDEIQENLACEAASWNFPNSSITVIPDLAGLPRVLSIKNHEDIDPSM